jgi:hypothetical protein
VTAPGSGRISGVERTVEAKLCPQQRLLIPAGQSLGRSRVRGSGYEQAEAEFCSVEGEDLTVALGPPP